MAVGCYHGYLLTPTTNTTLFHHTNTHMHIIYMHCPNQGVRCTNTSHTHFLRLLVKWCRRTMRFLTCHFPGRTNKAKNYTQKLHRARSHTPTQQHAVRSEKTITVKKKICRTLMCDTDSSLIISFQFTLFVSSTLNTVLLLTCTHTIWPCFPVYFFNL